MKTTPICFWRRGMQLSKRRRRRSAKSRSPCQECSTPTRCPKKCRKCNLNFDSGIAKDKVEIRLNLKHCQKINETASIVFPFFTEFSVTDGCSHPKKHYYITIYSLVPVLTVHVTLMALINGTIFVSDTPEVSIFLGIAKYFKSK